jgi:hypothetical protein
LKPGLLFLGVELKGTGSILGKDQLNLLASAIISNEFGAAKKTGWVTLCHA